MPKNLKMEFKKCENMTHLLTEILIVDRHAEAKAIKNCRLERESYEITDTCSPDFNFWRINSATLQSYLLTHELKHKFNYLQAV